MTINAPLLFFDSGVGGLSVLGEVQKALPAISYIYVADNEGFPYGTKSETQIADRVPGLLSQLVERYRPQLVVVACNTACTIALPAIRAAINMPIVGTVPAIKPAAQASKSRVIGLLGTDATIRQPYVDRLSAEFAADCVVLRHGSARLVDLAEAKLRGEIISTHDVITELAGLFEQQGGADIDQIVLACTHFPLLIDELSAATSDRIGLVDSGIGIARRVVALTHGQSSSRDGLPSKAVFTCETSDILTLMPALKQYGLNEIDFI